MAPVVTARRADSTETRTLSPADSTAARRFDHVERMLQDSASGTIILSDKLTWEQFEKLVQTMRSKDLPAHVAALATADLIALMSPAAFLGNDELLAAMCSTLASRLKEEAKKSLADFGRVFGADKGGEEAPELEERLGESGSELLSATLLELSKADLNSMRGASPGWTLYVDKMLQTPQWKVKHLSVKVLANSHEDWGLIPRRLQSHPAEVKEIPLHKRLTPGDGAAKKPGDKAHLLHREELQELLDSGCQQQLLLPGACGRLPLHIAVSGSYADVAGREDSIERELGLVKLLVEQEWDALTTPDENGHLPLHVAAGSSTTSEKVFNYILKQYSKAATAVDKQGWLPLHHVANGWGFTFTSTRGAEAEAVRHLLDSCTAGVTERQSVTADKTGLLPLRLAVRSSRLTAGVAVAVIKELEKDMQLAAADMGFEGSHFLKELDDNDHTFLHTYLARSETADLEVVQELLRVHPGAAEVESCDGKTALHLAAEHRSPRPVVKYLLQQNPEAVRKELPAGPGKRRLPLHVAIVSGAPVGACLELLNSEHLPQDWKDARCGTRSYDSGGRLPLHLACLGKNKTKSDKVLAALIAGDMPLSPRGTPIKGHPCHREPPETSQMKNSWAFALRNESCGGALKLVLDKHDYRKHEVALAQLPMCAGMSLLQTASPTAWGLFNGVTASDEGGENTAEEYDAGAKEAEAKEKAEKEEAVGEAKQGRKLRPRRGSSSRSSAEPRPKAGRAA